MPNVTVIQEPGMSAEKIAILGAIAGFTIYLGLPIGRLRSPVPRLRALLNAVATGILIFLLWDVLAHAWEPIEGALADHHYGPAVGNGAVLAAGLGIGLISLVYFDRWVARRTRSRIGPGTGSGPGTTTAELAGGRSGIGVRGQAHQLAMLIAIGIGLHNFAEGLAIGVSAQAGEIGLATVLIIGFALHNSTEGFGIVGPLGGVRPSWRFLGLAGLVAGGPTFIGAMVGYQVTSDALELCFFALAGGAILYVIGEIWASVRRYGHTELGLYMLGIGFLLGIATDLVVAYGGA
jgi:ZIP family zinc transporter